MDPLQYDGRVRAQYETLPYPMRMPADEPHRLLTSWLDDLPMINHYCCRGRRDLARGFRALVAGGGTGDATIHLAEQLRVSGAEVTHLDISASSMEIARERARVRGLRNVNWLHASVLDLPRLGLGKFDYINCSGVLHHLEEPDQGLAALASALGDHGALAIMVYGQYGRTAVYPTQDLMRRVVGDEPDIAKKIGIAKAVLAVLPPTNWWKRGEPQDASQPVSEMDDAEIYDVFLHSRDRAYTVPELSEWMEKGHGLHLHFTDVMRGRSPYMVEKYLAPGQEALLERVKRFPEREQHAIAELFGGDIYTHSFYATREPDTAASPDDLDNVPFFFHEPVTGAFFHDVLSRAPGDALSLPHAHSGFVVRLARGRYLKDVFKHIDGERPLREIFDRVRTEPEHRSAPPSDAVLSAEFRPAFEALNAIDRLLLRHRSVPRCKTLDELHAQMHARQGK